MLKSLRSQLIFIVSILVVLPLTISMSVSFYLNSHDFEKHARATNNLLVESLAANIQQYMENAYNISTELSINPNISNFIPSRQELLLKNSQTHYSFFQLFATHTLDGKQVARSSGQLGNRADRWWFKEFLETKQDYIGHSYYSVFSNTAIVTMVHGIYTDEKLSGLLMSDIETSTLQKMVEKYNSGPDSYAYILDGEGFVIVHPDKTQISDLYNYKTSKKLVLLKDTHGQPLRNEKGYELTAEIDLKIPTKLQLILTKVLQGQTGLDEYTDFNGDEYLCAYQSIPLPGNSTPWNLIMVQKKATALLFLRTSAWKNSLIVFFVLAIAIFFTYKFANRLTKPLTAITAVTEKVASGNLNVVLIPSQQKNEIGRLEISLNKMISHLKNLLQELEEKNVLLATAKESLEFKVDLRTQEITAANQELRSMNDILSNTLAQLQLTQEQLINSAKMASLGSLVAGIAHEINTPIGVSVTAASYLSDLNIKINTIYQNGQLTREDVETYLRDSQQSLTILLSNLNRAANLITSFKKVSIDQSREVKRTFIVKEYLQEVLLTLRPKFKNSDLLVTIEGDPTLEILSYPGALGQIITNLLDNSLIHAFNSNPSKGKIEINFRLEQETFRLVYRDNGIGMDENIRLQLFDPFFTTKRSEGGTGLGMHIVYNIVTQTFSGTIDCFSKVGCGTTFKIIFPLKSV